jgi:hypothetical protein
MSKTQITFEGVKGYANYANAEKRGEAVAASLANAIKDQPKCYFRWMVVAMPTGRFLPVFSCNNLPGGPGMLLGEANVGLIN